MRVLSLSLLVLGGCATASPPSQAEVWQSYLGNMGGDPLTEKLRSLQDSQGRISADDFLGLFSRKMGSRHDGDAQFICAYFLISLLEDPAPVFRRMLADPDPQQRAFALTVIGHLGDRRFLKEMKALQSDQADTGWDTGKVGNFADLALSNLDQPDHELRRPPLPDFTAPWLREAQKQQAGGTPAIQ